MSATSRVIRNARRRGAVVYSRRQWGSQGLATYQTRKVARPHDPFPSDLLFWHITVTRDDGPLSGNFFDDMQEVERIGYERFGTGFPYNWGIDFVTGEIGLGQSLEAAGAHTVNDKGLSGFPGNLNKAGLAIAFIGMPGQQVSVAAKLGASRLVAAMVDEKVLKPTYRSFPHSHFTAKDCPTNAVRDLIPQFDQGAKVLRESHSFKGFWPGT